MNTSITTGLLLLAACFAGASVGCGSQTVTCAEIAPLCHQQQSICVEATQGEATCERCPTGQYATPGGQCRSLDGFPINREFAEFTVGPGEEIKSLCQSWTLNNPEELWVRAVEMEQNEKSHHSIWSFVPNTLYEGPDGVWPCEERDYSNIQSAINGGILYAQSTQAEWEIQRFPEGAAVRVPPYSRIVGDVHLLNTSPESVTGNISLTLYTVPADEVEVKLVPLELEFQEVLVPARARSRLVAECDLRASFERAVGTAVDMDFYYILPHAHDQGRRLFMDVVGGPNDGMNLLDDQHYATYEPRGYALEPPVQVRDAHGIRFGCEYDNPLDRDLRWGFSEEMCQFLAYVDSEVAFSAFIQELEPGEQHGGMLEHRAAECEVLGIPWNHNREGGDPALADP